MTPGEVKRLDRKKCLIFMEEQYPIMDWKNLPFNTAVWKESERLAGKEDINIRCVSYIIQKQ